MQALFKPAMLALALGITVTTLPTASANSAVSCGGVALSVCPQPFDAKLPDAKKMLSWDQASRVIGFRNDYRIYPGIFSATVRPPRCNVRHVSCIPSAIRSVAKVIHCRNICNGKMSALCWC